jgi:hypothetical protein
MQGEPENAWKPGLGWGVRRQSHVRERCTQSNSASGKKNPVELKTELTSRKKLLDSFSGENFAKLG